MTVMQRCTWLLGTLVVLVLAPTSFAEVADDPAARIVELTNVERQKAGLPPLGVNPNLSEAAQSYAAILASGDCWAHTCGPVPDFGQRAADAGYDWVHLGENLAAGQTPEAIVAGWMASPAHRENILNLNFTEIGIGTAFGSRAYWVQEFGTRSEASLAFMPLVEVLGADDPAAFEEEAAPAE